ncbi:MULTISPECIES: 5-oxoprolinase subunit B family protein [unclassified Leisingera]|uniref:5-oxoprolinase subunit B family protein n=1 Tax=unclassified Leisingera TaxID=2614906 RepID=UPI0003180E3F|nr:MULTISPECIES: allophanate hydrolase subunit 1 [unclassified Leisingera]KIC14382.1 allophanate hydrolase [Leisingera sp. ANG-DT]KIC21362.1 allophanate hydrolase [Leisingera sp. ANG-S3]KIC24111.1 allophanate hydrolase [Leisingera sp. ANG-M6]KIC31061.1 allophanate hydrolase [Leisingera sp. ANG-S5]KIC52069.1 allophanate hydrolase [Leisingera sp. ANG-S]
MDSQDAAAYPLIRRAGLSGILVSFGGSLNEASNRAALAFRTAVEALKLEGVVETMASLASVFVRFEPSLLPHERLEAALQELLAVQDWLQAPLPVGRRFWRVPTVYGTDLAPQLGEAADAAGMSEAQAIDSLSAARVRVLTIGFAPGQPYLGSLGPEWDLPRQTELTPMVPRGALVQAIRQFVLFSNPAPTGWRHVGQTGMTLFQPGAEQPFALRPGDEMQFEPVSKTEFLKLCDADPLRGGAAAQEIQA